MIRKIDRVLTAFVLIAAPVAFILGQTTNAIYLILFALYFEVQNLKRGFRVEVILKSGQGQNKNTES